MRKPPKLSVLLVTYNHEKYIRQALDGVMMQKTDFDFEVVVADDYSQDSTLAIIEEYAPDNLNLRVLPTERNVGITRNYQRGFAACRGEFVAVLEGDDFWISPTKLKSLVTFLEQHPECALCFHRFLMHEEASSRFSARPTFEIETEFALFTAPQLARDNFIGNFSACVYRRELIDRLDPALFEMKVYDWMLNIMVAQAGMIGYLPTIMSIYRAHLSGVWSGKTLTEQTTELLEAVDAYNRYLDFRFEAEFQVYKSAMLAQVAREATQLTRVDHLSMLSGFDNTLIHSKGYRLITSFSQPVAIRRKIRRLIDLHKLWWAGDRITEVEVRLSALEQYVSQLKLTTERAVDEIAVQLGSVVNQTNARNETESARISHTMTVAQSVRGELQTLKSSLEVPQEMIDDFFAWKSQNPIPSRPLITVLVATYNRSRLLTERCIPSILRQTYDHFELIIVGDCCTDDTEKLVSQIKDPRLKFHNLPERGQYPSDPIRRWLVAGTEPLNMALPLAHGDFITHLDDDDEYVADRLEKLVNFAIEHQCDVVWHPFWWEQDDGSWIINQAMEFGLGETTTGSVFYRSWFKNVPWKVDAYRLMEPGDWNRCRRIKYIDPVSMRHPEPLLIHYRQGSQLDASLP